MSSEKEDWVRDMAEKEVLRLANSEQKVVPIKKENKDEGLLYRKIRLFISDVIDEYERQTKEYGWGTFSEQRLKELSHEVLDEALLEWLKIYDEYSDLRSSSDYEDYADELEEWVERWFGTADEEKQETKQKYPSNEEN